MRFLLRLACLLTSHRWREAKARDSSGEDARWQVCERCDRKRDYLEGGPRFYGP